MRVEDETQTAYQYPVLRRLLAGDLRLYEGVLWVPLIVIVLYLGFQPHPVTQRMNPTNTAISTVVHQHLPPLGGGR